MKTSSRMGFGAANFAAWLVLAIPVWGQDGGGEKSSEHLLPDATRAWVSVLDPKALNDAFGTTQLGQLAHDEQLKPFLDDLRDQLRSRFNDDQVRHGIKLSKFEDLETGEICLAGVLPRDAAGEVQLNKHGLILLVDVSKCQDKAAALLKEVAEDLKKNNATSDTEKFGEIEATKWTFAKRPGLETVRVAFHAIAGKWLVSSDNGDLFGQVVKRITDASATDEGTLAKDPVFKEVLSRCKFDSDSIHVHVRWFVDPFGYLDLARAIAEEDQNPNTKQRSNNFAKIVSNSGFDAIKGVAGNLAIATGQQEMAHRTFVYAPADPAAGENKWPKAAAVLDFANVDKLPFDPEPWVPESAASYATFTWNLEKVINHVHHVVDAVTDEGSFENMLKNIKASNNVDVRELVKCLNNRISVVSEVVTPIDANSEKILVGIGIKKNPDEVRQQVKNFFGSALKTDLVGEVEIYSEEIVEQEDGGDIFGDMEGEEEDAEEEGKDVMEQKFAAVHGDYILISNDLEYLKRIVSAKPQAFVKNPDYIRIQEMLDQFAKGEKVSLRYFSRLDRVFEANYELIRSDKLESANTMLAKLLTAAKEEAEKSGATPRKYDPSKMPDYDLVVAPRLGPTGLIMECRDDGWLVTSCLLKREAAVAEVAKEPEDTKKDN